MIETERLILRPWVRDDLPALHAMGQDWKVMRYLGPLMTRLDCAEMIAEQELFAADTGRGFWAIERRDDGAFLGFCGVEPGPDGTPVAGEPEIAWRLRRSAWGQGYAIEAARAALADEWARGTAHVAAITVRANTRSWGLMERLGMTHDPAGDFNHPTLDRDDPLRRHLLYRIARPTCPMPPPKTTLRPPAS